VPDAASLPRLSQAYPTPFASAAGAVLVCMATLSKWPPPLMLNEKNWSVVRRLVGYARLEPLALPALERLHRLAREYMNFLHPVCKACQPHAGRATVVRHCDRGHTPYQRLLAGKVLPDLAAPCRAPVTRSAISSEPCALPRGVPQRGAGRCVPRVQR
jgi:hypothetical protein